MKSKLEKLALIKPQNLHDLSVEVESLGFIVGEEYEQDGTISVLFEQPSGETEEVASLVPLDGDDGHGFWALSYPTLHDYRDGALLRPATPEEAEASRAAAEDDGGSGAIIVAGAPCYVID